MRPIGQSTLLLRIAGGRHRPEHDGDPGGSWRSRDGTTTISWWCEGPGAPAVDEQGIALLVGEPIDRTWLDPERAGRASALRSGTRPPGTLVVGAFGSDGAGWLGTDPLGLRHLYVGEDDGDLVLGTRARVVAAACGAGLPRSVIGPTILAHSSYWVGSATGYAGVSLAPAGCTLRVGPARNPTPRWVDDAPLPPSDRPAAEVADAVVEELVAGLRAALAVDGERHVLQLTGGRDSRMLLAAALAAGLADRFTYQTAGPDDHPDVVIARGLCARYGLDHETLFIGMRSPEPYGARARAWVEATGGMVSAWEAPGRPVGDVRITGVGGEVLRSFRAVPDGDGDPHDQALAVVERTRPGRLGLLRPEAAARARATVAAAVAEGDGDARRRVHLFYARNRMRSTRFGARLEVEQVERITPFTSPAIVRAALAVDGREREAGLLCVEVLRATAPDLLAVPFAGSPWSDLAASRLPAPPPPPASMPAPEPRDPGSNTGAGPAHSSPDAPSLVAGLFAQGSDERSALIADVLADPANPSWDAIDRDAAVAAAARWADLDVVERRELLGAISAALWAAG